ncbi:MAG TPA: N-acetylglucosamine-6-phosphate deacetylase [Pseudonocardiaceae bacterium]|jgi:N-acetylglucosamine-6-phosphate deacetylase|nr:N-acetylglucosamine-6-phosphate deacetylase [Pseudonocardiaceae bacterium]
MSEMLITAGRVVGDTAVFEPGWVRLRDDRIVGVGSGVPVGAVSHVLSGLTLVPGFVDLHAHGGGGASFDTGEVSPAIEFHRGQGTTTMVASLVTAAIVDLDRRVRELRELVADGELAGIHLEGPWLSARHPGAHEPALLRDPEPADVDRLLAAGDGAVRMVTIAPELPGAFAAVRRIVGFGALAAVGHTDADYRTTKAAIEAGVTVGTHLFNGMRPVHHREPGPVLALLDDQRVAVELIADGIHLHPAVLAHAARTVGPGRYLLVTDAMAAAGAADGDYRLGGLPVEVRSGVARIAATGAIAGSTLTLAGAVRHAVRDGGLPLVDAVRAASTVPARLLGRGDIGALAPGRRADLVGLDVDLRPQMVMRAGEWITPPAQ